MSAYASRFNYDKIADGYAIPQCNCKASLGCVIKEDPLKLWRCNNCLFPVFHPLPDVAEPTVDVYPPPYTLITHES